MCAFLDFKGCKWFCCKLSEKLVTICVFLRLFEFRKLQCFKSLKLKFHSSGFLKLREAKIALFHVFETRNCFIWIPEMLHFSTFEAKNASFDTRNAPLHVFEVQTYIIWSQNCILPIFKDKHVSVEARKCIISCFWNQKLLYFYVWS